MAKHILTVRYVTSFTKPIFNNRFEKLFFEFVEQWVTSLKFLIKTLKLQLFISVLLALYRWFEKNCFIYDFEHWVCNGILSENEKYTKRGWEKNECQNNWTFICVIHLDWRKYKINFPSFAHVRNVSPPLQPTSPPPTPFHVFEFAMYLKGNKIFRGIFQIPPENYLVKGLQYFLDSVKKRF